MLVAATQPQIPDSGSWIAREFGALARAIRFGLHLVSALLLFAPIARAGNASGITLLVGTHAVTANNVPAGGSIVLFTVARTTRARHIHLENWGKILVDDDGDGIVQFTPANQVPLRSIWIAADMASGSYAVAAHPDFPLDVQPLGSASFRKDSEGEIAALDLEIPRLILLLVRPGKGAWTLNSMEGGPGDSDGMANRKLSALFEQASSLAGKDQGPRRLKAGDFVAAVSPGRLDVWVATIGK